MTPWAFWIIAASSARTLTQWSVAIQTVNAMLVPGCTVFEQRGHFLSLCPWSQKNVIEWEIQRTARLARRYGTAPKEPSWAFQHRKNGEKIQVSKLMGGIQILIHCCFESRKEGIPNESIKGQVQRKNRRQFFTQQVVKLKNSLPQEVTYQNFASSPLIYKLIEGNSTMG